LLALVDGRKLMPMTTQTRKIYIWELEMPKQSWVCLGMSPWDLLFYLFYLAFGFFSIGLWGYQAWLAAQKFQSGNFALPQYDDESMAGAKPFASFPAPNVSQSNTFGVDQSQLRPADLTY
jgi:hypothetical protein